MFRTNVSATSAELGVWKNTLVRKIWLQDFGEVKNSYSLYIRPWKYSFMLRQEATHQKFCCWQTQTFQSSFTGTDLSFQYSLNTSLLAAQLERIIHLNSMQENKRSLVITTFYWTFPLFSHILRNASIQHAFALFKLGDTAQIYASVIHPKCCMLNGKFQLLGKRPEPYRGCSDISQSAAIKRLMLCSSVGSNWICCVTFSHLCLSLHHQIRVMFCCWSGFSFE